MLSLLVSPAMRAMRITSPAPGKFRQEFSDFLFAQTADVRSWFRSVAKREAGQSPTSLWSSVRPLRKPKTLTIKSWELSLDKLQTVSSQKTQITPMRDRYHTSTVITQRAAHFNISSSYSYTLMSS
jgi:hypothetical protein